MRQQVVTGPTWELPLDGDVDCVVMADEHGMVLMVIS